MKRLCPLKGARTGSKRQDAPRAGRVLEYTVAPRAWLLYQGVKNYRDAGRLGRTEFVPGFLELIRATAGIRSRPNAAIVTGPTKMLQVAKKSNPWLENSELLIVSSFVRARARTATFTVRPDELSVMRRRVHLATVPIARKVRLVPGSYAAACELRDWFPFA